MSYLDPLFEKFGIKVNDATVFERAFTHPSLNSDRGTKHDDYQRLEFLGDALLKFVMGKLIYLLHPEMREGDMTTLRSQFEQTESEAKFAVEMGLTDYILTGASVKGDILSKRTLLEDVFEAFIGALVLDQGDTYAIDFLSTFLESKIKDASVIENPKNRLQELIQSESREDLDYRVISSKGPDHDKIYEVAVYFEGNELGRGTGKQIKKAEMAAAADALSKLAKGE